MKTKTKAESLRDNPWKTATIVFLIVIAIMIVLQFIDTHYQIYGWRNDVCKDMIQYGLGTPSWFDSDGNLLYSGYIPFENSTKEDFENVMIDNRITFVYRETCSWCEKEIEEMNNLGVWNEYKDKRLIWRCN